MKLITILFLALLVFLSVAAYAQQEVPCTTIVNVLKGMLADRDITIEVQSQTINSLKAALKAKEDEKK